MSPAKKNFSNDVSLEFVSHSLRLNRYSANVTKQILGLLQELERDLVQDILDYDTEGVLRTAYKRQRAESLLKQTRETITKHYGTVHKFALKELTDFADLEKRALLGRMNKALKASVWTTTTTRADLREIVSNGLIQGSPARDWWRKQSRDTQQRVATQIRIGVAGGETNGQLVARLRGKRTGALRSIKVGKRHRMVPVYKGGVLETSKREAEALVRTTVQTISNRVVNKMYEQNSDLLRGKSLNVTLDNKTSTICIGLSGGAWDMEGNPLPESLVQRPYPGDPPYHWNCRTIPVPLTKSWDDLIEEHTGRRLKKTLETIPDGVRASMDGEVPESWTYVDWLNSQTAEEQRAILGSGRYGLWKDGKLTLAQLLDQKNRPLTLKQLEATYG